MVAAAFSGCWWRLLAAAVEIRGDWRLQMVCRERPNTSMATSKVFVWQWPRCYDLR